MTTRGGKTRLPLPNVRIAPPQRRMSLPDLKDVSPGAPCSNWQTLPSRAVLKDKGNLPKECLWQRQRPPEKSDYQRSDVETDIKKPCAPKKLSLLRKLKPRRNSTGALGKSNYRNFENSKMEPSKRSKLPLDSTWICNDSDSRKRTEGSVISNESSIVASEGGSSICVGWSRTYPPLDDEGNEVFPDTLGLKSRSGSQDESGDHFEVGSTALSTHSTLESLVANAESTQSLLSDCHAPLITVKAFSSTPDLTYVSDSDFAYLSEGKATHCENQVIASNYFSTPVAGPRPKGKIRLTPVIEVELECSSSEAGSASKEIPCNLKLGTDCERKFFPDLLHLGSLVPEELPPTTPGYLSFFATECMTIASQLKSDCKACPPSPLNAGLQNLKRKWSVFDVSTIDAEPLPFDSTPMKSLLYNEAAKVVSSLENTPANSDHSVFGASILDLDNMDLQLVHFVDGSYVGTKPSRDCKDEPCAVPTASCMASGSFKGLKCLPSFEGIDILKDQSESISGMPESETIGVNRGLNCKVEMFVSAAPEATCGSMDGKLNAAVTFSPAACIQSIDHAETTVSIVPKQDQPSSASQNLNLPVTKVETVTTVTKTQDIFVTALDIGTITPYRKYEIKVFPLLNTTHDMGQTSHSEASERDEQLGANVTQVITNSTKELEQTSHSSVSERDVQLGANITQVITNSTQELEQTSHSSVSESDVQLGANVTQVITNSTQELEQTSHSSVSESDVQLGANVTQVITNSTQELEQTSHSSVSEGDVQLGANVTQVITNSTQELEQTSHSSMSERDVQLGANVTQVIKNSTQELEQTSHSRVSERDVQLGANVTQVIKNSTQELEQTSHSSVSERDVQLGANGIQDSIPGRRCINVTRSLDGANATWEIVDAEQEQSFKANTTHDIAVVKGNGYSKVDFTTKQFESENYLAKSDAIKGDTMVIEVLPEEGVVTDEARQKEQARITCEIARNENVPKSDANAVTDVVLKQDVVNCEAKPCDNVAIEDDVPKDIACEAERAQSPPQTLQTGPSCITGTSPVEGEEMGLQKANDPKTSAESSVVLPIDMESGESSRRSLGGEVTHNDSCFSVGSSSFVTSTPLPGAMPCPFTKGRRSDTMENSTSFIIQCLNQSTCSVSEEPTCEVAESHQKKPIMTESLSRPSVCNNSKRSSLPTPANSSQRGLSKMDMSSRFGLPTARRALALESNEGSTNSREHVATKHLTMGKSIPTVSKTLRYLPTNSKTLLQKPGTLSTTSKAPGSSPSSIPDEKNMTSLTVMAEQASKNEAPSPNFKLPQATPQSKSVLNSQAVDKFPYKFTANRGRSSVERVPAQERRLSLRGPRTTESKLPMMGPLATVSKQMPGGPRPSEVSFVAPQAPDSTITCAGDLASDGTMSVRVLDASENKRSLATPRTTNGRTLQRGFRLPESRVSVGIPRAADSRMSLGTPRLSENKNIMGVQQTPNPKTGGIRAPISRLPMGAAGVSNTGTSALVTKLPINSNLPDSRSAQRGLRGPHTAETANRSGVPRTPMESRKCVVGFGFRPASEGTSGMSKPGHSALKIPGPNRAKSPHSALVNQKTASDQTVAEGASGVTNRLSVVPRPTRLKSPQSDQTIAEGSSLLCENGVATKRKLSYLPPSRGAARSGLRQPAKSKIQPLNPSPKRQRLAAPDLNYTNKASTSCKLSPRSKLDATQPNPASREKPRTGIKPVNTTVLISETLMTGAELIGTAAATLQEFRPVSESVPDTFATMEEPAGESVQLIPESMEWSIVETVHEIPSNVVVSGSEYSRRSPVMTATRTGNMSVEVKPGEDPRLKSIHKALPSLNETNSGLTHDTSATVSESRLVSESVHETLAAMEEPRSTSVHTVASTEEQGVGPESNAVPAALVKRTTRTGSTHETAASISESRAVLASGQNNPTAIRESDVGMDLNHSTHATMAQQRLDTESNQSIPTVVLAPKERACMASVSESAQTPQTMKKMRTDSESIYFTPQTSKKLCTESQSFCRTPWTLGMPRLGFVSLYETPCAAAEQMSLTLKAASFHQTASAREEYIVKPVLRGRDKSHAPDPSPNTTSSATFSLSMEKSFAIDTVLRAPSSTKSSVTKGASVQISQGDSANVRQPAPAVEEHVQTVLESRPLLLDSKSPQHVRAATECNQETEEAKSERDVAQVAGEAQSSSVDTTHVLLPAAPTEECTQTTFENHSPLQNSQANPRDGRATSEHNQKPEEMKTAAAGDAHSSARDSTYVQPSAPTTEECTQTTFENHSPLQDSTEGPSEHEQDPEEGKAVAPVGSIAHRSSGDSAFVRAPAIEECTQTTFENHSLLQDSENSNQDGRTSPKRNQELEEVKRELAVRDVQCELYVMKVKRLEAQCEEYRQRLCLLEAHCGCQDLEPVVQLPPHQEGEHPPDSLSLVVDHLLNTVSETTEDTERQEAHVSHDENHSRVRLTQRAAAGGSDGERQSADESGTF